MKEEEDKDEEDDNEDEGPEEVGDEGEADVKAEDLLSAAVIGSDDLKELVVVSAPGDVWCIQWYHDV